MAEWAIVTFYLPAGAGFDGAIRALIPQCAAGHPVVIIRDDGVRVQLSIAPDQPHGGGVIGQTPKSAWREAEAKGHD